MIRVISSLDFDFDTPGTIAADGSDIWVANQDDSSVKDSVTELDAATGKILRSIPYDALPDPGFVYADGTNMWVADWRNPNYACPGGGPSGLTEFSATNGAWEQTATGNCSVLENTAASLLDGPPGCYVPSGMVAVDGHIWFGSNDSVIGIRTRLFA